MNVQRYELEIYHCNGGEMLVSETGDYVSHDDYAALEAKCAALAAELKQSQIDAGCYKKGMEASNERLVQVAAENAGLAAEVQSVKAMNDCLSEELRGYESDGAFEGPKMHLLWWKVETPATDAHQAELRAQGVEMFAALLAEMDISCTERGALTFAAQLRKGAAQ